MKNRDNIVIVISATILILFMGCLFYQSYKRDRLNLIREDIFNDSVIMEEYDISKQKDSVLLINDSIIVRKFNGFDNRLYYLEKRMRVLEIEKLNDTIR